MWLNIWMLCNNSTTQTKRRDRMIGGQCQWSSNLSCCIADQSWFVFLFHVKVFQTTRAIVWTHMACFQIRSDAIGVRVVASWTLAPCQQRLLVHSVVSMRWTIRNAFNWILQHDCIADKQRIYSSKGVRSVYCLYCVKTFRNHHSYSARGLELFEASGCVICLYSW